MNTKLINLPRVLPRLDKIVEMSNPSALGAVCLRSTHVPRAGSTAELSIEVALLGGGWVKNGRRGNTGLRESKIYQVKFERNEDFAPSSFSISPYHLISGYIQCGQ